MCIQSTNLSKVTTWKYYLFVVSELMQLYRMAATDYELQSTQDALVHDGNDKMVNYNTFACVNHAVNVIAVLATTYRQGKTITELIDVVDVVYSKNISKCSKIKNIFLKIF